jgi:predicted membrane protein
MNGTHATPAPRITGRLIVGGVLILLGLLFTLDNLGYVDAGDILDYWPLVLIVIGVVKVRHPQHEGQRTLGYILIALGAFFLFQIVVFQHIRVAWPFVLVVIGGLLVWRALRRNSPGSDRLEAPSASQSDFAFMGGVHRIVETPDFRGGYATAVMGAVELDLRGAKIVSSPAVLDVFALWGGIEITVSPDWKVDIQVVPILGGVENKARSMAPAAGGPEQVLIVRGTALMGGIEIKS